MLLASPTLLPEIDARLEAAHELGLDDLRGSLLVAADVRALADAGWHLDVFTGVATWIRANRGDEGAVRISPQQIRFPVGARLRWSLDGPAEWGVFAFHQSNHDVDEDDPAQNDETVAYEVYGAEWVPRPGARLAAGVYYDRGTRLDGRPQLLPFDYYLAGLQAEGRVEPWAPVYLAAALEVIAHRNPDHDPAWVNLAGHVDLGVAFAGAAARWLFFLRFQRVEDYQRLGDEPRHLLLLGTGVDSAP